MLLAVVAAGQVMEFDGVDQYADLPDSIADGSNVSVSVWAKASSTASGFVVGSDASPRFYIYLSSGSWLFRKGAASEFGATPADTSGWHHLVMTYAKPNVTAYLDGIKVGTQADTATGPHSGINIGSYNDGASSFFSGHLDDPRFYSTALSSNQIARLTLDTCEMYDPTLWTNSTLHAIAETWDTGYSTNMVGWWRGDRTGKGNGQAFTNIVDISGNNNDGTAVNSPTIEAAR